MGSKYILKQHYSRGKRTQGLITFIGSSRNFINNTHEPQNKICIRKSRLLVPEYLR